MLFVNCAIKKCVLNIFAPVALLPATALRFYFESPSKSHTFCIYIQNTKALNVSDGAAAACLGGGEGGLGTI